MTVSYIYDLILATMKKDVRGNILSPADYNLYLENKNEELFNLELKVFEENSDSTDALEQLKTKDAGIVSMPHDLPVNYGKATALWYIDIDLNEIKADEVTELEYQNRKNNYITKPTAKHPVYRIREGKIYPDPATSDTWDFEYIRYPLTPYLDFYYDVNGNFVPLDAGEVHVWTTGETDSNGDVRTFGDPDYNSLTVEFEWKNREILSIFNMVLALVGVSINKQELSQYGMFNEQKSEQK